MSAGLLTRKQSWRRQARVVKRHDHDFLYNEGVGECGDVPSRSASEPTVSGLMHIAQLGRLWATTGDLNRGEGLSPKKVIEKKKVKFQPAVRVVLIPSRSEYATADITVELWWDDSDYSAFKASAVTELKALMRSKNICNSKEAIRLLYQPSEDDDNISEVIEASSTESSAISPPAPTIEDFFENSIDAPAVCTESEMEVTKLAFLVARTDLDLTPTNFEKTHCHKVDTNLVVINTKKIHPLAYMCE